MQTLKQAQDLRAGGDNFRTGVDLDSESSGWVTNTGDSPYTPVATYTLDGGATRATFMFADCSRLSRPLSHDRMFSQDRLVRLEEIRSAFVDLF